MAGTIGLNQVYFVARIASMKSDRFYEKRCGKYQYYGGELVFDGGKGGCF